MLVCSKSHQSTYSQTVFAAVLAVQVEEAEVEAHREVGRGDDGGETQLVTGVRGWEPWAGQGSRWVCQQTVAGWVERHEGQDANT